MMPACTAAWLNCGPTPMRSTPVMVLLPTGCVSTGRNDGDLYGVLWGCKLCLHDNSGRGISRGHPLEPDIVHLVEAAQVGEPDSGREQLRLVGACGGEQLVDSRKNAHGLLR